VVESETYDLDYVVKNIQQRREGDGLDIPAKNRVEESEISQKITGNVGSVYSNHRAMQ
jgi:hypothetical protein